MNNKIEWQDAWMSEVICPHCNGVYDIGLYYKIIDSGTVLWCRECEKRFEIDVKTVFATSKVD